MTTPFTHRIATMDDIPAIRQMMEMAIRDLQKGFLSPEQVEASFEVMGLDTQLIEDGTYFLVEHESVLVGCGGWSWRNTLFGANHTAGRNASALNPEVDPARIRAMYTHPAWARRGIGKMIMSLCENAVKTAGFKRARLAATLAGQPLYNVCGYVAVEPFSAQTKAGINVPLVTMEKTLDSDFH